MFGNTYYSNTICICERIWFITSQSDHNYYKKKKNCKIEHILVNINIRESEEEPMRCINGSFLMFVVFKTMWSLIHGGHLWTFGIFLWFAMTWHLFPVTMWKTKQGMWHFTGDSLPRWPLAKEPGAICPMSNPKVSSRMMYSWASKGLALCDYTSTHPDAWFLPRLWLGPCGQCFSSPWICMLVSRCLEGLIC